MTQDTPSIDPNKVLDRIKYEYKLRYDKELAELLGISQASISHQRTLRAKLDLEAVVIKCCDRNLNWILFGDTRLLPPIVSTAIASGTIAPNNEAILSKVKEAMAIIEDFIKSGDSMP
ncbi:MAG: hypothetical protein DYG96_09475 [Chlorobi bacterium CHB2]|nr:hypothetical protein [Chlorobi bacterium CHB2]